MFHSARLRVSGGEVLVEGCGKLALSPHAANYVLDLRTRVWSLSKAKA